MVKQAWTKEELKKNNNEGNFYQSTTCVKAKIGVNWWDFSWTKLGLPLMWFC